MIDQSKKTVTTMQVLSDVRDELKILAAREATALDIRTLSVNDYLLRVIAREKQRMDLKPTKKMFNDAHDSINPSYQEIRDQVLRGSGINQGQKLK